MANPSQAILYVGPTTLGKTHDYKMLKEEFSPTDSWFEKLSVWVDLGYMGFAKDYPNAELQIPVKKPYNTKKQPNRKLSPEQKAHNKFVARTRVKVENAIGGIKRYPILVHKFRNKRVYLRDKAIFIAAGLWNFHKGFSFN